MSIAGILSSSLFQTNSLQNNNQQQIQKEFQQLGQDLQAGSLTQAQSDFATITANQPTGLTSTSPSAQAFSTLGQDLKSGNLSAAQQAFSTIQQAAQSGVGHVHHHHHGGASRSAEPASSTANDSVRPGLECAGSGPPVWESIGSAANFFLVPAKLADVRAEWRLQLEQRGIGHGRQRL